jgi:hypothetical protein
METRIKLQRAMFRVPVAMLLVAWFSPTVANAQAQQFPQLRLLLTADANGFGNDCTGGAAGGLRVGRLAITVAGHYDFHTGTTGLYAVERELRGVVYSAGLYQPLLGARPRKRRPGAIACPAWGNGRASVERIRIERRIRVEGVARIGYQREVWDYRLSPRSTEGVPPSRTYRVHNNGAQAAAGFSIRYASLCAEIVFSATATLPAVESDHNPFGDGLHTHQRPFAFRLTSQPLARIGFSIPLTKTNTR